METPIRRDMNLSVIIKTKSIDYIDCLERTLQILPDSVETICLTLPNTYADINGLGFDIVHQITDDRLTVARNRGVELATKEYVAFLDDDAYPSKKWATQIMAGLNDSHMVGGPLHPDYKTNQDWLPQPYHWLIGCGPYYDDPQYVPNTYGSNLAVERTVFESVGGFDESIGMGSDGPQQGAETDLCRRITEGGYGEVYYDPEAIVYHTIESMAVRPLLKRAYHQGKAKAQLGTGDREKGFIENELLRGKYRNTKDILAALGLTAIVGAGYIRGKV